MHILKFFVLTLLITTSTSLFSQTKMQNKKTIGHAEVNGINMYYEIYGSGKPLVLIHGGGSTIEITFGNLIPLLKGYQLIAVELQAHGRTSDRNAPETFEQDADDVAALLKHLKIQKADILGFSNGGTTTLQLAIRHPGSVNKIVVISAASKRDGMMNGFFDMMKNASLENMPAPLKEGFLKVNPDQTKLQTMFEKDRDRMINFKDIDDNDLQAIKCPALFMVGDKDVVTVEHTQSMTKLLPNAQLVVLPGFHGEFIGEMIMAKKGSKLPEISAALIEEFLK